MNRIVSLVVVIVCFYSVTLRAQTPQGINVSYSYQRLGDTAVVLKITAKVPTGLKLYTMQRSWDDAVFSSLQFDSSLEKKRSGSFIEKGNIQSEFDSAINGNVYFVSDSLTWSQHILLRTIDTLSTKLTINLSYSKGMEYLSEEKSLKIKIYPNTTSEVGLIANSSLFWIFLAAFGGGLLALLTPCVYSMIPVTVSFFTKRSKSRKQGIRNALYYALSIVLIFTLLGFFVTTFFGPAALNNLATNWISNLLFFALFLIFGFSFLGAFDISLPSKWSSQADSRAGQNNFFGIFFMAMTLVLVSFSCTGPIIGNLLVLAAKGSYLGPLVGMFGFSFALALPFALFAFFPSKLNILGKAGGWLNAVKVTLGFMELALALKFFSNADLAMGWRLMDREVFLVLWIIIFFLLGLYLLGKIRFHHDDELPKNDFGIPYVSVTRITLVIFAFGFSLYMLPGLFGAPLKAISAFVPPMGTQDFTSSGSNYVASTTVSTAGSEGPKKYADKVKIYEPDVVTKYGLVTYFDYDEALAVARKEQKPLMLDFTGINCVNCRKMEGQVWSDPEVMQRLKDNFVIVSLYVDVQNIELPDNEQHFSKDLNKQIETLGDKNAAMQVKLFGANTQPYYFFLDGNGQKLVDEGYGYDPDIKKFIAHLDKAYAAYKN
ncbi:protein-disulfide reductase DsbD family protein [Sediminibacterium sp.]|uniref:protein-disulfide reductase DsbD family protein n=1 Tax=Sediminibacterium sp. TaxID=1917865 RepID=UPI003F69CFB5